MIGRMRRTLTPEQKAKMSPESRAWNEYFERTTQYIPVMVNMYFTKEDGWRENLKSLLYERVKGWDDVDYTDSLTDEQLIRLMKYAVEQDFCEIGVESFWDIIYTQLPSLGKDLIQGLCEMSLYQYPDEFADDALQELSNTVFIPTWFSRDRLAETVGADSISQDEYDEFKRLWNEEVYVAYEDELKGLAEDVWDRVKNFE